MRTVALLSWTYGAFYFCRINLSVAVPGIWKSVAEGGLGFTKDQTGTILAGLKITYGVGQLLNGQLAEYFSPRQLLALGMLGSAALNVAFGLTAGFTALVFIWAANGYFQSLGWTPCVRVAGNWVPGYRRGQAIGIMGLGYQVTGGLTYLVASVSASQFGWRGALYVPAAILTASALFMLLFLEDTPLASREKGSDGSPSKPQTAKQRRPVMETLYLTFSNPALWLLGISLGALNACRYGFVDWGIAHLVEVQNASINKAGLQYGVLALGAVPSVYLTGWITDRFFAGRRVPVIVGLMLILAVLTVVYGRAVESNSSLLVGLLAAIGFCVFGPQVLLVGTAPADFARGGTAAAAAGFVNFMGYLGAATGDFVTGYFLEYAGWQKVLYIWAGWAVLSAVTAAMLWNAKGQNQQTKT
jgi:OPA family glycerol-3-phosphate transporter-like MFS transporter